MTGPAWREVRLALTGALLLARGDARGFNCFDASPAGFWRSFAAAPICYPFYLMLAFLQVDAAQWAASGGFRIVCVETIDYVISWTAFPLIVLKLCDWFGRDDRFFGFMVPYNWCQVVQIVAFAAIGLAEATGLVTIPAGQALGLMAVAASFLYEWYIARVALDVSTATAIGIVAVDLLLATVLSQIGDCLY